MSKSGTEAAVVEQPLLIAASPKAQMRNVVAHWAAALTQAGIAHNWSLPQDNKSRLRISGDWPVFADEKIDAADFATVWGNNFLNSAGLLVLNPGVEFIPGISEEEHKIRVVGHFGAEPDRAVQRALGVGLPVVLSDGYTVGHPSPLLQPEALQAQGIHALDPSVGIEARVAQLPSLIGGLLVEPPAGGPAV